MSWWDRQFNKRLTFTDWTPIYTPAGAMTMASTAGITRYCRVGSLVFINLSISTTVGGVAADVVTLSLPITAKNSNQALSGMTYDPAVGIASCLVYLSSTAAADVYVNWTVGAGRVLSITGYYEAA